GAAGGASLAAGGGGGGAVQRADADREARPVPGVLGAGAGDGQEVTSTFRPVACYTQQGVPAPPSVTSAIRAGIAPSRFLMLRRSALCLLLALAFAFVAFPSNAPAQKLKDGQVSFYGSAEYRGSQKLRTALSNATEDYNPTPQSHNQS